MLAPTCPAQLASRSALAADAGPTSASDSIAVRSAAGFRILAPFVVRPCGRSYARVLSAETRSATVFPPCCHGSFAQDGRRQEQKALLARPPPGIAPLVPGKRAPSRESRRCSLWTTNRSAARLAGPEIHKHDLGTGEAPRGASPKPLAFGIARLRYSRIAQARLLVLLTPTA